MDSALCHYTAQIHQQYDFGSALHHHTAHQRRDQVLKGSAHLPLGDTSSGIKDQEGFLQRLDGSNNEGTQRFLPKKSGHLQKKGETDQDDGTETLTLHSEQFVVPGAQNIIRVLGAPNFVKSARSTGLCKSAWGTMVLKCCLSSVGSHQVRSFHFSILLHCSPTPNQSWGIIISFRFNFSNCSIFFFCLVN